MARPPIPYTSLLRVTPTMRFVFGPSHDRFVVAGDVSVSLDNVARVEGVVQVSVTVPPHDKATSSNLQRVFAVLAPAAPAASDTPEAYMNAPGRFVGGLDVAGDGQVAQALVIDLPNVTPGSWFVQTILQFED